MNLDNTRLGKWFRTKFNTPSINVNQGMGSYVAAAGLGVTVVAALATPVVFAAAGAVYGAIGGAAMAGGLVSLGQLGGMIGTNVLTYASAGFLGLGGLLAGGFVGKVAAYGVAVAGTVATAVAAHGTNYAAQGVGALFDTAGKVSSRLGGRKTEAEASAPVAKLADAEPSKSRFGFSSIATSFKSAASRVLPGKKKDKTPVPAVVAAPKPPAP